MQLGDQISQDYAGKDLIAVGVLKGVIIFMTDLLRAIRIPVRVDYMDVARYGLSRQTRGQGPQLSVRIAAGKWAEIQADYELIYLDERTTLGQLIQSFVIWHVDVHCGEISALKGVLGLKGYPF